RKRRDKLKAEEAAERLDLHQTSRDRHVTSEGKAEEEAEAEEEADQSLQVLEEKNIDLDHESFDSTTGEFLGPERCDCGVELTPFLKENYGMCFNCSVKEAS